MAWELLNTKLDYLYNIQTKIGPVYSKKMDSDPKSGKSDLIGGLSSIQCKVFTVNLKVEAY